MHVREGYIGYAYLSLFAFCRYTDGGLMRMGMPYRGVYSYGGSV